MAAARLARVFLWIVILVLLSACAAQDAAVYREVSKGSAPTPTSVLLVAPSQTPLPATPVPEPTLTMTPYDDPDYYYGGMIITLDDVGREIILKKRQNFLLSLGKNYNWRVAVEPGDIITVNINITPEPGDQGIFVARRSGRAVLKAVGEPLCRYARPACDRPDILFQIQVLVE